MCGGVIFPYSDEYLSMLERLYSPQEVDRFRQSGQVRSLFWQKAVPVLPILPVTGAGGAPNSQRPTLMLWGNRDKDVAFPRTGWARLESIEEGKWGYLRPEPVVIPASYGVEKGKWFTIGTGIAGLVVERFGEKRVYMLTRHAEPEFLSATHHDRMPMLIDQADFPWLPGDPGGTLSAFQTTFPTND